MTTPSSNSPFYILEDAYKDAKLLANGDQLGSEQLADGLRRLTDLVNAYQTEGLRLWLDTDLSIPLVASQTTYTLGPSGNVNMTRPLRVEQAYYLDSATPANSRPISVISWNEYLNLGQRAQTGALASIFIDKGQTLMTVYCWPVPDAATATGTLHVLIRQQVTNPVNVTETMNFPIEWRIALRWGLAAEICTGQPASVVQKCEGRAELYKRMLNDWDVEDVPTRFTPDMQMTAYTNNSFR